MMEEYNKDFDIINTKSDDVFSNIVSIFFIILFIFIMCFYFHN